MKTIIAVVVAFLAVASARPGYFHTVPAVVVPVSHQYHAQDILGQYTYGYSAPLSAKSESRAVDGSTVGGYSYVDPNGQLQSVQYSADAVHGFQVAGTNLPVAKQEEPKPVEDTPEVAKAKKEHFDAVEEAKARDAAIVAKSGDDAESVEVGTSAGVGVGVVHQLAPTYYYNPIYSHPLNYYHSYPYHYAPVHHHQYSYVVPQVYTNGHQANELPTDDAAVAKAAEEHAAAHKEVKAKLAAAGVEVN